MSQAQGLIGERLGSFRIEAVLGAGAMGVVYRGVNEKNGRAVAVKVVSPEFSTGGKIHERFEREAEILQQFRHPNIVRFLAVGRYRGTSYFAMELIQGKNLERLIQERGPLPWREVVELGKQTCDALHYAHERGVVHRDLKPSNLMVTEDGRIKLTDFGIAKDLDKTALTATGRTLGTAAYMAPEQIRGTPAISHKTDLYAFGVVLYQMLVGKPPFEGASAVVLMHCHLNEPAPRPSAKIQDIPRALDDLVVALMAKAPADRPWDAAAVGVVFDELKQKAEKKQPVPMVWGESATVTPAATGAPPAKTKSRKKSPARKGGRSPSSGPGDSDLASTRARIETALLVAALAAIGGFIVYWLWPPSQEYLFHQAEKLMASKRTADWVTARDDYLDPLDQRFPNHPYREKTQAWRDQILLDFADRRSRVLASSVPTPFSEPSNEVERQFVVTLTLAKKASERYDDMRAMQHWLEFSRSLKPEDPDQRGWYLLALDRAQSLKNMMADRRQVVERQIESVVQAFKSGKTQEGEAIRDKVIEQYMRFTDLADLFVGVTPPAAKPGEDSGKTAETAAKPPVNNAPTPTETESSSQPQPPATSPSPDAKKPAARTETRPADRAPASHD